MWSTLHLLLLISSAIASNHFEENSEEHKSGYGYVDQEADFGHDHDWLDEEHKHNADSKLSQGAEHHANREKFADSGIKKHSDEAVNRGKDSKKSNYGFFDYHYAEPQYHLEKFYTNEQRSRNFDEGERSHAAARHQNGRQHADNTDQDQHQAKKVHSSADRLDRSESGQYGHKDSFDEHHNRIDKNSHAIDSTGGGPFKDGHYVPRFAPY